MIKEQIRRIWYFLNRRRFRRSLEDEMQFHREMMEREGRSGFGNTLRLREEARDAWGWLWLDYISRDFRYGLRVLRRSPGFTIATIAVLSLGIGGNTAMFSTIYATLLKPLPYRDPSRLVLGRCTFNGVINPYVSAPDYYDYRAQADRFEGFSAVFAGTGKATVTGDAEPQRATYTLIEHDLFKTLGVPPIAGRSFVPDEGRAGAADVVLIGKGFAERRFGTAREAIGASIAIDGSAYTVVGVVPDMPGFLQDVDIWAPMRRGAGPAGLARQFHNWFIVGRLKPGVSLKTAQAQVDVISRQLERQYPASNKAKALRLDPLQAALTGALRPRLLVLMAAVSLVLLIACANVAGLLLARGTVRRPELAMRAALGASRARISCQLLVENAALALSSGAFGAVLAIWLTRLLPRATGVVQTGIAPNPLAWPVLLFVLALSVVTAVLSGMVPALRASSLLPAQGLMPNARTAGPGASLWLRSVLVVGQVAVSLVLLIGAGLLIRSFVHLSAIDPGFDAAHLLTGEIPLTDGRYANGEQRVRFFENLREDLAAIPGVQGVGFTTQLPVLNPGFNLTAWDADHPPQDLAAQPMAFRRVLLPGYFQTLRIPLRAGRDFNAADRENAPRTMVINERMARTLFPGRNPLGRRVAVDVFNHTVTFEVIGVVGDARLQFVGDEAPMTMYLSYYQFPESTLRFAVRTNREPASITGTVRRLVRARDRTVAVENLVPMRQIIGDSLAPQQTTAVLLGVLAAIAALLASIGLYGVLAYSVSQRTREIGLRMALGAPPAAVLGLVMRQGAALASAGLAVGLAGAATLTRVMGSMLFGVQPFDPPTYSAVAMVLLGVALLATYLPARRAAGVHPMDALRHD